MGFNVPLIYRRFIRQIRDYGTRLLDDLAKKLLNGHQQKLALLDLV
ncbi:MAG: hypothetical protein SWX82_20285 [Cyanobacteriota bacterium]|nr:hypothetical protein [Cyanobacteriota bacterium]